MKFKPKPRFGSGMIWPDYFKNSDELIGQMLCQPIVETNDAKHFLLDTLLPDQLRFSINMQRIEQMLNTLVLEKFTSFGAAIFGITPEYLEPLEAEFPIFRDLEKLFS